MLCIGAETLSRITDFTDRGTCILLADAAGAAVLRAVRRTTAGIIDTDLYSDGRTGELLLHARRAARGIPPRTRRSTQRLHYAKMKGNEVFKVAVRMFGDCAERILERNGFSATDIDLFIPHQANLRIIEAAVQARRAADGARVRQRRPLRQHGRRLRLRRARGGVVDRSGSSAATSCSWPPSAAASPGARRCCAGRSPAERAMTIAFLFPGQGSQAVGMGRAFAEASPAAARGLRGGQRRARLRPLARCASRARRPSWRSPPTPSPPC